MNEQEKKSVERLLRRNPNPLEEDRVKELLRIHLESEGWNVKVKWGKAQGVDIVATKAAGRWVIEAKGWAGGSEQQQGNYFLQAVCELLQRMDREETKYSLAFPELPRFRGLWERFPLLAKRRTAISCLFVAEDGKVVEEQ